MYILSLETSTNVCSVALHSNENLLAYEEILIDRSHAEHITIMIDLVCKSASVSLQNIDAVALSVGPGSYTGLRIASSTAKGLCYTLNKPLIAISTLQAMAFEIKNDPIFSVENHLLVPMIDARRMEVFTATFNAALDTISDVRALIVEENAFIHQLEENKMLFFGNGAQKCMPLITHKNAVFIDNVYPTASSIGALAVSKYLQGEFEDIVNFEPYYLKEFYIAKSQNLPK